MKKVKILNVFLILLIAFHVLDFVLRIYLLRNTAFRDMLNQYYASGIFGQLAPYILMVISTLTVLGLFFVQRVTSISLKKGFFNFKCVNNLKLSALFFFLSGMLSLIFDALLAWSSIEVKADGEKYFSNLGQDFLIVLLGFSLYIIADVIQNGNLLQEDNELTI